MNKQLYRGSLETIILKLLSEKKEMYGYEITQVVKEMTDGELVVTEGALYPTLHKLEAKGILSTETKNIGNRYRKYYSITEQGQTEVEKIMDEMRNYLSTIQLILNTKTI